ncbi:MAG: hypothetical protein CR984_00970 [Proteobacteria bacterium]|nr:MAG: hypothetical protein CR984_00970 [Pseudomonadota bacterium]PIE66820.1 MAG: hypothetical protein CSA23_07045 [Deltaproteobacteria bacterium]
MIDLCAIPLTRAPWPQVFGSHSTWHVWCVLLLIWIPAACTHLPTRTVPTDDAAVHLMADLVQINKALKQFKCVARITLTGPDRPAQTFRAAIAGQYPNRLRIDLLAPFGGAAANFSSDGNHLYLVNHRSREYHKIRLGAGSLSRLLHVDVTVEELVELLLGRVPMASKWQAKMTETESRALSGLAFHDIWGIERQRIDLNADRRPVGATWYDRRHHAVQRLVIDALQVVDGFDLPESLELKANSGDRVKVRIERYMPNAPIKDSLFILEPLPS